MATMPVKDTVEKSSPAYEAHDGDEGTDDDDNDERDVDDGTAADHHDNNGYWWSYYINEPTQESSV